MATQRSITFDEWLAVSRLAFEWADSSDSKDWNRLSSILAPHVSADFTSITGEKWEHIPASEYVNRVSSSALLGNPLLVTQHLLGAAKWTVRSETEIVSVHQVRAAHQRFEDAGRKAVAAKGHGHAIIEHQYSLIEGQWKLSGLCPTASWHEHDFERIFVTTESPINTD